MKRLYPLLLGLFFLQNYLAAQTPVQTLRGSVTDAGNGRPLPGATVVLLETSPQLGAVTGESGVYFFEKLPVGRYRMQVSHVGYETLTLAEVLVAAGKETVQDVRLQEQGGTMEPVVVKAQARSDAAAQALSAYTITVEEQFRFPATFNDPGRLVTAYPGVAGNNDGTNIISVRGNSPNAVKWRLEGVEIVNPNHTANAGTFSDRPAQAGGGVNILSAQLLGTSVFMAGAFPPEYGNALGGMLDMRLRRGNDHRREFTAQAGFVGIEAAAEGPLGSSSREQDDNGHRASYLANYRYSFTGLLAAMGADLGDEETAFQDASFHLSLPSAKAGHFSIFGLGGQSNNAFLAPADSTDIMEDKQRFNIDFTSKMGALGMTHVLPLGRKSVLRTVAAVSALQHRRTADLAFAPAGMQRQEDDDFTERKIALSAVFSHKIGPGQQLKAGLQALQEMTDFRMDHRLASGQFMLSGNVEGWLLQPFVDWNARIANNLEMNAGLRLSHFTFQNGSTGVEPSLSLAYAPSSGKRLSLAYSIAGQTQLPHVYASPQSPQGGLGLIRSHQWVAGYRQAFGGVLVFNAETYFQRLSNVAVLEGTGSTFSALNLVDFSLPYLAGAFGQAQQLLTDTGKGRNYGLDLSLQRFFTARYYFLLAASLYRSEFAAGDGVWRSTRMDGGHVLNLTGGREFLKNKNGKILARGINARIAWLGGFRDTPIDETASQELGYTVYREAEAFSVKLADYWRADLRFYLKWNKTGRSTLLSLDIQNVTGRKNEQFRFYDSVTGQTATKRQLGLIPILSWRGEF